MSRRMNSPASRLEPAHHLPCWLTTSLALLIACPVAALPPGAPLPDELEFGDLTFSPPRPERLELGSGLVVFFLEDRSLPLVDIRVLIRAGAVNEPPGKAGLADLVGDVMRNGGTRDRAADQLNAELENMASNIEPEVGKERVTVTGSSLARHFPETFAILADLLRNPAFAEDKLEIARARAIERVRRQNDDPLEIVEREFAHLLYPEHPYGRTPAVETLEAITRDDLLAFHRRFFGPDRTVIAVSGALSERELRQLVDKSFGGWRRSEEAIEPAPPVADVEAPKVSLIAKDVSQSAIRIGHLGIDRHDPDRVAVGVMNVILGRGGFNSRLVKRVRVEAGIAYWVGSIFTLPESRGLFFADTQTRSGTTAQAIELLTEEITRMRDSGITPAELEEARDAIVNRDIFAYATAARIVFRAAELSFQGYPPDQHDRDLEAIRSMTVEQVNAVAAKHLHPGALRILVVGNPDRFEKPLSTFGEVNEVHLYGESSSRRE